MPLTAEQLQQLNAFFEKPACRKGTTPLGKSVEIALYIGDNGPATLSKESGEPTIVDAEPKKADMSFWIPEETLRELISAKHNDVGEIGIDIAKAMIHEDPTRRMRAKVHIGLFDLVRKGYLSVIPLGGASFMKFLASKGLTGMGKIKSVIQRMKDERS